MANFNGTWKLSNVENFDAYLDALAGVTAEVKTKAQSLLTPSNDIRQEISVNGNSITVKSTTPLGTREHTSNFGDSFTEPTIDGREMKVVISQDGNALVETQTGPYTSNNRREIAGGNMVYTLTANGVSTKRTYTRV